MSEKKICDECGREITEKGLGLHGVRFSLWGHLYNGFISKDFCSKECLIKFVKRLEKKNE